MGCVQTKPAAGGDRDKTSAKDRSSRSPHRPGKATNGSHTQQRRRSTGARGPPQSGRNRGAEAKSQDKKNALDVLGILELDIVVKDPERLGLASDFNEQAAEQKPPREFSFEELSELTHGFDDKLVIGEGGFGRVYRGRIPKDDETAGYQDVAIKKLNQESMQGFNEWLTEVIFLRRLRHPHLVRFVGYCTEEEQGVLVYEFMENGSLDYHLFSEADLPPLTWEQRVKVALGAAKGLAYLHEGTGRQVIFRDLKAANILLDKDFHAKLSDFGLARDGPQGDRTHVSTKVVGTLGYTAPEYMQTGHLTAKSDVYAFGVVLLELLSGRRAVDESKPWEQRNLAFWAKPFLADKRKLPQFMDPKLGSNFPPRAAQKLAVAASCCLLDVKSRPSMIHLVQILTVIKEMGENPGESLGKEVEEPPFQSDGREQELQEEEEDEAEDEDEDEDHSEEDDKEETRAGPSHGGRFRNHK